MIDDLAKQLALFGDERRQFVDQALSRLSESATDEQWAQVERLALGQEARPRARRPTCVEAE